MPKLSAFTDKMDKSSAKTTAYWVFFIAWLIGGIAAFFWYRAAAIKESWLYSVAGILGVSVFGLLVGCLAYLSTLIIFLVLRKLTLKQCYLDILTLFVFSGVIAWMAFLN